MFSIIFSFLPLYKCEKEKYGWALPPGKRAVVDAGPYNAAGAATETKTACRTSAGGFAYQVSTATMSQIRSPRPTI